MALVTVQEDAQKFPASLIYDPANTIQGVDANTSRITNAPSLISLSNMLTATNISVQAKAHKDDVFREVASILGSGGAQQQHEFATRWNYVQLVRTGAQNIVAYAQQ